jgi:hypothetical protein
MDDKDHEHVKVSDRAFYNAEECCRYLLHFPSGGTVPKHVNFSDRRVNEYLGLASGAGFEYDGRRVREPLSITIIP